MTDAVIETLNRLNQDFYDKIGIYFDNSRQYSWNGWERILSKIKEDGLKTEKILDLGCGNGRFASFLKDNLNSEFCYKGIDSNFFLLNKAEQTFGKNDNISFVQSDVLFDDMDKSDKYDLIAVFGVMHHIPSFKKRVQFLSYCRNLLNEGGILTISLWNFVDDARISKKKAEWSEIGLNRSDIDENDYLLTWDRGERALRYCHYFSENEQEILVENGGLKLLVRFNAEGKDGNLNTYLVLEKA